MARQICACGWKGENCSELNPLLDDANQAMDTLCVRSGFDHCVVNAFQDAYCYCKCGFQGEICDKQMVPYLYNYVCGFVLVFVFLTAMSYLIIKRDLRDNYSKQLKAEEFVEPWLSWIGPKFLMVFRLSMILVFFPIAVLDGIVSTPFPTFTMWNWLLFGAVFMLGSVLSISHVFRLCSAETSANITLLHKYYWILFEVELVSATFIDICIWVILLPGAVLTDQKEMVLYPISYFMHAVNFIILFTEFCLNRLYFNYEHWPYLMVWGGCYYLFHTFYMLGREVKDEPHCPVYPFLNMSKHYFLICSFIIPAASLGLFIFYCKISRFKQRHINPSVVYCVEAEARQKKDSGKSTFQILGTPKQPFEERLRD